MNCSKPGGKCIGCTPCTWRRRAGWGVGGRQRLSVPDRMTGDHIWDEGESERLRRTDGLNEETPVGKSVEKRQPLPMLVRMYLFSRKRFSALVYLKPPNLHDGSLPLVGHSYRVPQCFPMRCHTWAVTAGKVIQDANSPTSPLKEMIKGEDLMRLHGSHISWNLGGVTVPHETPVHS